jgi:hypothetical protein
LEWYFTLCLVVLGGREEKGIEEGKENRKEN